MGPDRSAAWPRSREQALRPTPVRANCDVKQCEDAPRGALGIGGTRFRPYVLGWSAPSIRQTERCRLRAARRGSSPWSRPRLCVPGTDEERSNLRASRSASRQVSTTPAAVSREPTARAQSAVLGAPERSGEQMADSVRSERRSKECRHRYSAANPTVWAGGAVAPDDAGRAQGISVGRVLELWTELITGWTPLCCQEALLVLILRLVGVGMPTVVFFGRRLLAGSGVACPKSWCSG
jgi:hypothetical protein